MNGRSVYDNDAANSAFNQYYPRSREQDDELNYVPSHLITRIDAIQVHPIPNKVTQPQGPFPRDMFREPEIVIVTPNINQDGSEFALGATAQNNYKPPQWLRCGDCYVRVLETETGDHVCG